MKPWLGLVACVVAQTASGASDFNASLSQIERQSAEIDRRAKSLGFPFQMSGKSDNAEDRKQPPRLFVVHDNLTNLRAPAGRMLIARTVTRLIVGTDSSPSVAEIGSDQGLFSGLRVLGKAQQSATEGRVAIEFNRVVFRSGKTISIKAVALDEAGAQGLKAHVFSSKALMIAGAMASSFITGYASAQQTQTTPNAFGFTQTQPSGRNAALQGVAQTAADQSKRLIDDATKEKPILVVEPGTEVAIYLEDEVRF